MAETKSKVIIGLELDIANAVKNVQGIQGAIAKIALDPAKKDELLRSFGALEKEMLKASSTAAQGFKDSKEMDKFALGVERLKNEFSSLTNGFKELGIDSKTIEPQTKEFALYSANVDKASKSILDLEEKLTRLSAKQFKGAGAEILGTAASGMGAAAKANDKQGIQDIAASSLAEINTKRQEAATLLENITVAEKTYNITTEEGLKDVLKTLDELIEARREYWRLTRGSDTTFATLPPEQQARLAPVQNLSIESMQAQQTELRSNYKAYADLGEAGIDVSKMEQTFTKLTADIEKQNAALSKNIKLKAAALGQAQGSTTEGLEEFSKGATGAGLSLDQGLGTTQQEAQRTKQLEQTAAAYGKIGDNIKRLTGFHAVFSFLKNVIRNVWQDVQQLDKQFNEIAVVTDYTTSEMWDSFSKVNSIAQEYGVTTSNVISVQKLYYQQGKSTIEVNQLTGETLTLAKIAGLDYADATDKMTAALNAYNLEATSATMITDTLSALAAQSAADTAEIANALTRTASIAANAGMGLQETTVWLTKMISTTREPAENLGTALKTIIARFSEIKDLSDEDLVLLGADFDFNRVEKALRSVRISLKDTTGQVRDVDDVFMDLSKVWDTLDRNTQRYIATNAAGSRQQSRFIAMISDYKETLRLTEIAQNSSGTGALQLATTMEGLETSINNLKSAWQQLYSNFMDSEVFQTVLGLVTQLVLAVSDAAPALTIVIGLLATLKGLLLVSNTILLVRNLLIKQGTKATLLQVLGLKAKAASQTEEIVVEQMVAGSIVKTTVSRKLDTAATMGQVTAETILKGIQTWGIALAVIAAITITALAMSKRAEANATTEQAEAAGTYNKSLAETTKKTNELTEVTQKFYRYRVLGLRLSRLTNEELEEYNDLIDYLSKNLEGSIENYDAEGNAVLKNNDALQEAIKAKEEAAAATKLYNLQLERQLALEHGIFTINSKAGQYLSQSSARATEYGQAEKGSLIYQDLENLSKQFNVSIEDLQKFFSGLANQTFSQEEFGLLIGQPDLTRSEFEGFIERFNESIELYGDTTLAFQSGLQGVVKDATGMATKLTSFNSQFGNIISNLAPSIQNALSDLSVSSLTSNFSYLNEVKYETGLSKSSQELFGTGILDIGKESALNISQAPIDYINDLINELEQEFIATGGSNFGRHILWKVGDVGESWSDMLTRMGVVFEESPLSDNWDKFTFADGTAATWNQLSNMNWGKNWWKENRAAFYDQLRASADKFYDITSGYHTYLENIEKLGYDETMVQEVQDKFASYTKELDPKVVTRINEIVAQLESGNVENSKALIEELNSYYGDFYQKIATDYKDDALAGITKKLITDVSAEKAQANIAERNKTISKLKEEARSFGFDFLTVLRDFSLDQIKALREVLNLLTEGIDDEATLSSIYGAVDSMLAAQPGKAEQIIATLGRYGPEATDAKGILKLNVGLSNIGVNAEEVEKTTRTLLNAYIKTVPAIEDVTDTVSGWTKEINDLSKIISGLLSGGSIEDLSALLNSSFMLANPGLQAKLMSDIIVDEKTGKYRIAPDSEVLGEITTALTGFYQDTVSILLEFIKQEMDRLITEFGPQEQMEEEQKAMYASYETAYGLFKKFAESSAIAIQESIIEAQKEAIRKQIAMWEEYIDALKDIDIFSNLDELLKSYENRLSNIKVEQDLNLSVQRGQDLLNEEVSTITEAMAAEQVKYNRALAESKTYAEAIKTSGYGTVDAQGRLIIKQEELRKLAEKIANASDDKKDSLQAEYDRIVDMVAGYQEMQDILNETYANTLTYAAELRDIYKEELSYVVKVEERILQLLQERDDKALEAIKKRYDALKKADDDYLSTVRDNIEKERQLRDQATQYDELAKKEQKLNLLIAASGGKKTATIIALEREVSDTRQALADQAVDNLITALEDEAEKRAETYDNEVAYQEEILSMKKENMIAYNAETKAIMSQNKNDIIAAMKALDEEYIKGTAAAQETWVLEWEKNITDAKIAMFALTDQNSPLVKAQETINEMQNSTIAFTSSLQSYTNALVGSIQTVAGAFDAAYSKAVALVEAYKSLISEYERLQGVGGPPAPEPAEPKGKIDYWDEEFRRKYEEDTMSRSSADRMSYDQWLQANSRELSELMSEHGEEFIIDFYLNQGNDDPTGRLAINAAEEQLRSAQTYFASVKRAVADAEVALDQAQQAYEKAYDAYLRSNNTNTRNNVEQARWSLDAAQGKRDKQFQLLINASSKIDAAQANLDMTRQMYGYKEGGLVNYTGPAWVDGTPAKPEAFLSSKDTSNIAALTNVLDNIISIPSTRTASVPQSSGPITYQIEINVEELGEGYTVDNLYDDMEKKILDAASKGKVIQV